jgi:hypothetical protein
MVEKEFSLNSRRNSIVGQPGLLILRDANRVLEINCFLIVKSSLKHFSLLRTLKYPALNLKNKLFAGRVTQVVGTAPAY